VNNVTGRDSIGSRGDGFMVVITHALCFAEPYLLCERIDNRYDNNDDHHSVAARGRNQYYY